MKPYLHSKIHTKKYGGKPEDYADIDDFLDSSKAADRIDHLEQTLTDYVTKRLLGD